MMNIPTINLVRTGQNIMKLRNVNGLSVKDIQGVFGFVTPQAIYKWQHGDALPTVDNLVVLSRIFHVNIDDILIMEDNSDRYIDVNLHVNETCK